MVYLTGDTHGELDRFKDGELRRAGKGDLVVVLGDFGFVWDGSKAEQKNLDWLRKRPYTILFLDGSHENYDLLEQYPTEERFGGLVQPLGGNVYHVCRGSVLELEGKKYLCFGGAESPDKEEREAHVNWWPQEMPSDEEYARCEAALEANGWQVDYVLTHDAPSKFLDFSVLAEGENNRLHLFLDKVVMPSQGCAALYQEPLPLLRCSEHRREEAVVEEKITKKDCRGQSFFVTQFIAPALSNICST